MKVKLEWKPQDLWVGVYWRRFESVVGPRVDVWICLLPCVPIRVTWWPGAREVRNGS